MDDPWLRQWETTRTEERAVEAPTVERQAPGSDTITDRIIRAIGAYGFPPLRVEDGEVVLSGFIIEPERDACVKVRWTGQADVNSPPYRRTFLSVYAFILLEAGLTIQYVADEPEPHLICRAS
jgi:hypothetical protein